VTPGFSRGPRDADVEDVKLPVVAEPFQSDPRFWRSVAASADALIMFVVALPVAWLVGPRIGVYLLLVPVALLVRAGRLGRESARASRSVVGASWRDAERQAVARAFVPVLLRPRHRRNPW
jgi:hypothetical protein